MHAPKAQRLNQVSTKRYKRTVGYGATTKPVIVLPSIRTKTSLLGPFKKLNCLDDLIYITTEKIYQVLLTIRFLALPRILIHVLSS